MRLPLLSLVVGVFLTACWPEPTPVEPSTPSSPLSLEWPTNGARGSAWVINNYVDLDPTTGMRDYTGATGNNARTYNGHLGIDIDIGSFRRMDSGEALVLAAAPGTVERVLDGAFDRNLSCTGTANLVDIRHADGTLGRYAHFRRNSIVVAPGQRVATGTRLGVIGSSGCSTNAHLHFELRDAQGGVLDPFLNGLWKSPPAYDAPLSIMEAVIRASPITQEEFRAQIFDPEPDAERVPLGRTIGVGVIGADGPAGSRIRVSATGPAGVQLESPIATFSRAARTSVFYANMTPTSAGLWTIRIFANDVEAKWYTIMVTP